MMYGSDRILACPVCGDLVRVMTLLSGNTFGARSYTDGDMRAPMLPDTTDITRCQGCADAYWLADAAVVWDPEDGAPAPPRLHEQAAPAAPVSEELLADALASGLASDSSKEIYLRARLWWIGGRLRRDAAALDDESTGHRRNMQALITLLDEEDSSQRLAKAELARQLGRFDEARRLIQFPFDPELRHRVAVISRLIDQRNTEVSIVLGNEGLTDEEKREIQVAADQRRAEQQSRESARQAFLARQEAAREQGIMKEGDRCPKCGFSYAWDGTDCHHCHFPKTRA